MHRRTEIRNAVVTLFKSDVDLVADENIVAMNPYLKNKDEVPAINVTTGEESTDADSQAMDDEAVRELNIYCDLFTKGLNTVVADQADAIAEQIENAFNNNNLLGGLVMAVYYRGVSDPEISGEGEQVSYTQRMIFQTIYDW